MASVDKPGVGQYCINFSESVSANRVERAVVGLAGGGSDTIFARVANGQAAGFTCPSHGALMIKVVNSAGAFADGRFSFVVP